MDKFLTKIRKNRAYLFVRQHLGSILKILVSVLGLVFVLWSIPAAQIRDELVIVSWFWLFIAFAMVAFSLVLRAFRWLLLLKGLQASVPFGRLVELYFVGNFFNSFLPSGFGGDAVRIIEVARDVPANIAAGTVLVDRLSGLMTLFAMALLLLPFRPEQFPDNLALIVAMVCLVGLVAGAVLIEGSLIRRFGRWLPPKFSPTGDGPVAQLMDAVQGCGWKAILGAFGVSFIFNLLLVAWWEAAARALGIQVSYTHLMLVVPLLSVALLVPKIGGLGVRELIAGPLFASANVRGAEAVALSLLVWLIMRAVSLLGAPVYIAATIRENRKRRTETAEETAS